MPAGAAILTKKERVIAREEAKPVVAKVRSLLLRSGARGIIEYQQGLAAVYEAAQAANASAVASTMRTPPADVSFTATQRQGAPVKPRRLNPEDLKSATRDAGVLLSPTEYKALRLAFTDDVGFVMIDTFLSALAAAESSQARAAEAAVLGLFPADASGSLVTAADADGESCRVLPAVTLHSLLDLLVVIFAPLDPEPEGSPLSIEINNTNARLQLGYEDAADVFTLERYPSGQVSGQSVLSFFQAVLEVNSQDRRLTEVVLQRLGSAASSLQVPTAAFGVPAAARAADASAPSTFSMMHTGVRTQRKFEYYQEEDRRDEWIRGRNEKDAGKAYQRHIVGYAGHLPEYQYHFGRTFHVIEEDLPLLSKPKPPLEAVPADAYGPARELKESRMNAHHYRLA